MKNFVFAVITVALIANAVACAMNKSKTEVAPVVADACACVGSQPDVCVVVDGSVAAYASVKNVLK